ncbi:MAG: hypothetical protein M3069_04350 [Chloroflexota bacterium]|nr:hypothetical protein [Chloroflexota bacterium]
MADPTQPQVSPSISPAELFSGQPASGQPLDVRRLLPSLLVNAGAPFVAYQVLAGSGMGTVQALTVSAVFPAFGIAWGFARTRRPDMIGSPTL